MIITLIGMSGTGKSYWSKKLEEAGYKRFGCDDLITDKLAKKFNPAGETPFDMHQWVGYPDEETYTEHAQIYLQTEEEIMNNILDYVENAPGDEDIVIDSTGSVIYMPGSILKRLKKHTKIIYLDITSQEFASMLKYYLEHPVAIIWNDQFQQNPGEPRHETFVRCHPKLIHSREKKYKALMHFSIPPAFHRSTGTTVTAFQQYLNSKIN